MERRTISVVRPDLQHIADIDNEDAVDRRPLLPVPVFKNLKAADRILQKDRNGTSVAMVMDTQVRAVTDCVRKVR